MLENNKERCFERIICIDIKKIKLRAVIMWICPVAIPIAMRVRKLKYHVNVSNR